MAPNLIRRFFKQKTPVVPPPAQTLPTELFRSRGEERAQNSDWNGAVVMYDEALKNAPTDTTLLLSRSFAHMMSTPPKLDLALQDADAAVQQDPTVWKGWFQKGEAHLRMGDYKKAEEALVNAVGCAQGVDKLNAQRSLADARSQNRQTGPSPSAVEPPPTPAVSDRPPPAPTTTNPEEGRATSRGATDSTRTAPAVSDIQTSGTQSPSVPHEPAPPEYTPDAANPDPAIRTLSQQTLRSQLSQLQTTIATRNRGSISVKPYTAPGSIDAVLLVYVGMTQFELTARELGTPAYQHASFGTMAVNALNYPGNTFLDMDSESSGYYDGKLPGTISISGYSEEYRNRQLLRSPLLNLTLEGTSILPTMALDKIVDRIRLLQQQPTLENNEFLKEILGLSQITFLQSGLYSTGSRQRQIEDICMALNHSIYEAPTRFVDFSKARNFSNNTLGTATQGIGLQNFLFQILLGAELLVRLRKEPVTTSYAGLITDATSALMVLSALWMENVTIQGPSATATTPPLTPWTSTTTPNPRPQYTLLATNYQQQVEGLIRFGELLSWPYMDETRNYIENAYQDLITRKQVVGFDICDWLFGLILPGKIFRHRIMCCLVYASPSVRSLNPAPFFDNGLIVKNKSYWPKRSVLGRVLGGLKNPKSVCGWIGPLPAPEGGFSGWIRLNARSVDIPVPANTTEASFESLGFGENNGTESPAAILQSITNPNEWIQACPPSRPRNDSSRSVFKRIHLTEIPNPPLTITGVFSTILSTSKEYRASLDFEVNGTLTCYTLYSNPIFVYAPPCVGTHTMHRRQTQNYLSNVVRVADLKEADVSVDKLVIVDALGQGEEAVARAWCAERARNAVIRRDGECCFACAISVTVKSTGLGFNVLIWSS